MYAVLLSFSEIKGIGKEGGVGRFIFNLLSNWNLGRCLLLNLTET